MADKKIIHAMIDLQPTSKFIYLVRSLDMSKAMRDYDITVSVELEIKAMRTDG